MTSLKSASGHLPPAMRWAIVVGMGPASLGVFVFGMYGANVFLLAGGATGLCFWATQFDLRPLPAFHLDETPGVAPELDELEIDDEDESSVLVKRMLSQDRYALLLRPQIVDNLNEAQYLATLERFETALSLVPAGQVVLGKIDELSDDGRLNHNAIADSHARLVNVEPAFLDRFAVTNAQYYQFVVDGGYDQIGIWDQEIWPAVLDFVDRTGQPGPKYWRNGRYAPGEERLPVVGVSWYEACAYSRWAGKRLPTDAEWVKAGCWPVSPAPDVWVQRRFPWGNTSDLRCSNLWDNNLGGPAPVDEFAKGASVGGIHQLVGNVWEWTTTNFGCASDVTLTLPVPMKSIRGGAFDTYFENQATCHFQSGENPLARKRNLGFRLALGVCDLAPRVTRNLFSIDDAEEAPAESTNESTLEVSA
jgi:iron(II)-dependent oxidoreductase